MKRQSWLDRKLAQVKQDRNALSQKDIVRMFRELEQIETQLGRMLDDCTPGPGTARGEIERVQKRVSATRENLKVLRRLREWALAREKSKRAKKGAAKHAGVGTVRPPKARKFIGGRS